MLCYINNRAFTYFRKYFSELHQRDITPDENNYLQLVQSELRYRIEILSTDVCSCSDCKEELARYLSTLELLDQKLSS